uniref:Uncharacterized protein n=1 Tax=Tetranychus urticae TaxID=32264 RepID=T1KJX4_TETUR
MLIKTSLTLEDFYILINVFK